MTFITARGDGVTRVGRVWRSRRNARVVAVIAIVFATILAAFGVSRALSPAAPQLWIDEPLDGAAVIAGMPVAVVGHVNHVDGLQSVRLDVDGVEVAMSDTPVEPGTLATVQFEWAPTSHGIHVVTLWAKPATGDWIGPALASVNVGGPIEETTTTIPPPTTTIACSYEVPVLVSPPDNADLTVSIDGGYPVPLSWSYDGCNPEGLTFHVHVGDDPEFVPLPLYSKAVTTTDWTTPPLACGDYWWRVRVVEPVESEWSEPFSFILDTGSC